MGSRRSEVSTALNDSHVVSFSSHLHSSSSSLLQSGSSSSLLTSATSVASMAPAAAAGAAAASAYMGSVLMQGKLMRRDRTFLTWKWRDFTLERTRLQYFSEKGIRKGEIALTPTTPITIRLLSEPKPHSFLLFIKDEKLTLAALNENEQRKWIDVFCDVFHASVEQAPSDKGDRRTRPTFLPIPDISTAKDTSGHAHGHAAGANGSSSAAGGSASANGGNGASASAAVDREPEVIPILESRMTYGPIKESYSRVTFPPSLANGDLLVGVGPIVRRMGWTDERILAVGLYIDPEGARKQLETFHGRTVKSLYGDQTFYDHVLSHTTFRRSFVITSRKRVSKSVLTALLHDEIAPRIGTAKDGLDTFLGFIEKSLKKAESMVLRVNPDGRMEYRLRGQLYPPIASHALCKCIQAVFFDVNSIQHDAKRGLIERLPSLWGGEALDAQDEIFGRVSHHHSKLLESESEYDGDEFDEFGDDDDDDFDDDSDDDLGDNVFDEGDEDAEAAAAGDDDDGAANDTGDGAPDTGDHRPSRTSAARKSEFARRKSRRSSLHHRRRTMSRKEELDDLDEREHEYLRRESRSVTTHFGPLLDPDSNVHFASDLVVDGSALLGTWSQTIERPSLLDASADAQSLESVGLSAPAPYRFTVGLYVEPGGASENLLKYKGLSVGSIVQDPDFFARFAQGSFRKHLVFKVESKMRLHTLMAYFDAHLKHLASRPHGGSGSGASLPAASPPLGPQTSTSGAESGSESKANESFLDAFQDYQYKQVRPRDEVRFSIEYDGRMTLFIRTRGSVVAKDASSGDSDSDVVGRNDVDVPLPSPPFAMLFQSIFYGFHTIDARSRAQLMQRLPNLLDLAKDDLVHTYHDEIQVLKENYKRQKPENRVKVGYMAISFEKKKLTKTIDGAKEPTVVPSRWSKRWCRLDGVMFSYFSHKRSRKARDVMDLTACDVAEITSLCANELAPFAVERDSARPSIKIAITKPNGEILALRTESIYEGEEWLESLTDASQVRRLSDAVQPPAAWENSMARLRRSSSVYRSLRGVTPAQLEALKSSGIHRTEAEAAAVASGAGVDGTSSGELDAQRIGAGHTADDDGDDGDGEDATELLAGDLSDSDAAVAMVVDKDASLLLWVREDPRHGVIAFLLVLVLWLMSSRARADAEAVLAT